MLTSVFLARLDGVRHAFFTREGGVSCGHYASLNCGPGSADRPEHVQENRRRAAAVFNLPANALVTVRQVHGNRVTPVLELPADDVARSEADGMVTNSAGILLGILTADCAPVLLADAHNGIIGAAHAGWRGAFGGVSEATVAAMRALGAEPSFIHAAIGPCIAQASYQVGADVREQLRAEDSGSAACFYDDDSRGKYRFDLAAYTARRLARAGVRKIDILGRDTYREQELFFSYRRACHLHQAAFGLGLSAIAIDR